MGVYPPNTEVSRTTYTPNSDIPPHGMGNDPSRGHLYLCTTYRTMADSGGLYNRGP